MTTPDEAVQAMPCPRCASENVYIEPDERGSGSQWVFPVHIGCNDCGINLICNEAETVEDAVSHWNERALPFLTGVKVKALEWVEPSKETNGCWIAKCEIGTYSVVNENGWYAVLDEHAWGVKGFEWISEDLSKDTRQTAFDAAQADYEARIRSAIEVATSPRAQALEEARRQAFIEGFEDGVSQASNEINRHDDTTKQEALNAIRALTPDFRALSSQPVADGWLPIETAPKDGTVILCADRGPLPYVAEWKAAIKSWVGSDGYSWEPTHWRHLPASPGASE